MNNDRTIVIENVSNQSVGLKDTQNRTYRLGVNAKIRISQVSLQDILDYPASRVIFAEGLVKVSNVTAEVLYNMGLTEAEIKKYSVEALELAPAYDEVEDKEEETKEEVEEKEEVKKEAPKAKKTTTTRKSTAKKTTTKKSTTKKSTSSEKAA